MKLATLIFSFFALMNVSGQKLVDQFGYSSDLCSGTYFLYSDSSFVYERGCEGRSAITVGTYRMNNDTSFFYPKRLNEFNVVLDVAYLNIDSSSTFVTTYATLNNTIINSYAKYPLLDRANQWAMGQVETDSLSDHSSIEFDNTSWRLLRTSNETLGSCPIELERLINKRLVFPLSPDINEIQIRIALPDNILILMNNYEMTYEEMNPGISNIDNRTIKTIYL